MNSKIPIANIYYLLSYAWDCPVYGDDKFLSTDTYKCPEDFWCKVLDFSIQKLRQKGFRKEYNCHAESIPGIKGKLLLADSIKSGDLFKGQAHCEFDDYSVDHKLNQIIKATLLSLFRSPNLSDQNILVLKQNLAHFSDVGTIKLDSRLFQSIRLNTHNKHYSLILNISSFIFNSQSLSDERSDYSMRDFFSDNKKMHVVFEKFVRNFYRAELKDPRLEIGSKKYNWITSNCDDLFKNRIPTLSTDTTIQGSGRTIIIDTKFYSETLVSNWGSEKYSREHLSQIMDYMRSAGKLNNGPIYGMLLYPTVQLPIHDEGTVEGLRVKVATINLLSPWDEIHQNLLGLLDTFTTTKYKAA